MGYFLELQVIICRDSLTMNWTSTHQVLMENRENFCSKLFTFQSGTCSLKQVSIMKCNKKVQYRDFRVPQECRREIGRGRGDFKRCEMWAGSLKMTRSLLGVSFQTLGPACSSSIPRNIWDLGVLKKGETCSLSGMGGRGCGQGKEMGSGHVVRGLVCKVKTFGFYPKNIHSFIHSFT